MTYTADKITRTFNPYEDVTDGEVDYRTEEVERSIVIDTDALEDGATVADCIRRFLRDECEDATYDNSGGEWLENDWENAIDFRTGITTQVHVWLYADGEPIADEFWAAITA